MINLYHDKRNLYRNEFERVLKENDINVSVKLLEFLFDADGFPKYVIKKRYIDKTKTTIIQRLNTLWIYPLFILVTPFRYIILGYTGVNSDSKLGEILTKLLGNY